jgi:hypothetical protein
MLKKGLEGPVFPEAAVFPFSSSVLHVIRRSLIQPSVSQLHLCSPFNLHHSLGVAAFMICFVYEADEHREVE